MQQTQNDLELDNEKIIARISKELRELQSKLDVAMGLLAGFLYSEDGPDYEGIIGLMERVNEKRDASFWGTKRELHQKIWELEEKVETLSGKNKILQMLLYRQRNLLRIFATAGEVYGQLLADNNPIDEDVHYQIRIGDLREAAEILKELEKTQ